MLIGKARVAHLIPHAGAMCLLDGVLAWDNARIHCVASSHGALNNPLRHNGRLGVLCGVEYAAQAMALHGALTNSEAEGHRIGHGPTSYLATVRGLVCHTDRLDLLPGTLGIVAEQLHGEAGRVIYRFTLRHEDRILLDGRAALAQITR